LPGRRICHYDIIPWLEPDWVLDMASGELERREDDPSSRKFRRPAIDLEIVRCDRRAWALFGRHHYLNTRLHPAAHCFAGLIERQPAAFVAAIWFPHPVRSGWREHRCVCLPDFQGVGIGSALSDFVASMFAATGKPYRSVTSHPAMMHHRIGSDHWRMVRAPSRLRPTPSGGCAHLNRSISQRRVTASFEYIGEPRPAEAQTFGIGIKRWTGSTSAPVADPAAPTKPTAGWKG
jgi:GNAT superfamily N-acetyltransferase